jgi:hypothetical protein
LLTVNRGTERVARSLTCLIESTWLLIAAPDQLKRSTQTLTSSRSRRILIVVSSFQEQAGRGNFQQIPSRPERIGDCRLKESPARVGSELIQGDLS